MGWSKQVESHRLKVECSRAKQQVRNKHNSMAYLQQQPHAAGSNMTSATHFVAVASVLAGVYLWQVEGRRLRSKSVFTFPIVGPLLKALTGQSRSTRSRPSNPRRQAADAAIRRAQQVWCLVGGVLCVMERVHCPFCHQPSSHHHHQSQHHPSSKPRQPLQAQHQLHLQHHQQQARPSRALQNKEDPASSQVPTKRKRVAREGDDVDDDVCR